MIREYTSEDLIHSATLLIEAYNREPWFEKWTKDSAERHISELTKRDGSVGYLLFEDETLSGVIIFHKRTWWSGDEVFIDEIYVKPDARQKGHGSLLLKHCESYCRKHKIPKIVLRTNRAMPSVLFYEKHGFVSSENICYYAKSV